MPAWKTLAVFSSHFCGDVWAYFEDVMKALDYSSDGRCLNVIMSSEDDDYSGQSVLIFCCKGMIEGIIVMLFTWLLIQVLFTKHLEVHLQILLGVGLVVFCLTLILGCVLCCRDSTAKCPEDKEDRPSPPLPPAAADHVTLAVSPSIPLEDTSIKVPYDELEQDVPDFPSAFGSSTPSDDDFSTMPFASRPQVTSELNKEYTSCFPLRRLSSPTLSSPLYRPMTTGRSSLHSFSKPGLLSKTQKGLKRHCTVSWDTRPKSESIRLTTPSPVSHCALSGVQTEGQLLQKTLLPNYGSNLCTENPDPCLHFTLTFSPAQRTVTISLLSLTGTRHRLEGVTVQASLPPLLSGPLEVTGQRHSLVLEVSTLEELQNCTLRLGVFTQEISAANASLLGMLEVHCGTIDWISDRPIACTKPLGRSVDRMQRVAVVSDSVDLFPGLD